VVDKLSCFFGNVLSEVEEKNCQPVRSLRKFMTKNVQNTFLMIGLELKARRSSRTLGPTANQHPTPPEKATGGDAKEYASPTRGSNPQP
jgi:hypothetical protein